MPTTHHFLRKYCNQANVAAVAGLATALTSMISITPYYPEYIGFFGIGGMMVGALGGCIGYEGYRYCFPLLPNAVEVEMEAVFVSSSVSPLADLSNFKEPQPETEPLYDASFESPLLSHHIPNSDTEPFEAKTRETP